MTKFK